MYIAVFITASKKKEAHSLARAIIRSRLAACVNITAGVDSLFWWKGKVDKAREFLLIVKSRKDKLARLVKLVKSLHSYETPEIIALPLSGGYKPYLNWIDESLR